MMYYMSSFNLRIMRNLLGLLSLLCTTALTWSTPVTFQVDMEIQCRYGRFQPLSDQVVLRGDFNDWSGNEAALTDPDSDSLYTLTLELPSGGYSYKYVMFLQEEYYIWETTIPNRWVVVGEDPLTLPVVYFDDDDSDPIPPRDMEVRFRLRLDALIESGVFKPGIDQAAVFSDHPQLGNWGEPGVFLSQSEVAGAYVAWHTLSQLSNYPVYYKFVILGEGDPGNLYWEPLPDNRNFVIDGTEADDHPQPGGNGVPDLVLPVVFFGKPTGWLPGDLVAGADISWLPRQIAAGAQFYVDGEPAHPHEAMPELGYDQARLRIWHTPDEPWHGLDSTLAHAQRLRAAGLELLLNFHLSDTWADPGHQTLPAAWVGLDLPALVDSVYNYTYEVITLFAAAAALPAMVQIGNEIDNGMLWDWGRVGGVWDTPQQWSQLGQLLNAGITGVLDAAPTDPPLIMLHIAQGGNNSACRWWYDGVLEQEVDFDVIGLSFYPWWHGTLAQLQDNLMDLAQRYDRDIQVVETAYPWTLNNHDEVDNIVWHESQLPAEFSPTPGGQASFMQALREVVRYSGQAERGGVWYWEPTAISVPGLPGNPVDNLTLFDAGGQALPGFTFGGEPFPVEIILRIGYEEGLLIMEWEDFSGGTQWRLEEAYAPEGPWHIVAYTNVNYWTLPVQTEAAFYRVIGIY